MSDTSLVFNLVARERVSETLGAVSSKLTAFGTKITSAVAGVGVAAPYVAAAAAAAGTLAAGAIAAGAAVGAFKAAAGPQLAEVTNAWTLYDAAQQAAAQGGEQAATAQKAYTDALAKMQPATRDTAEAFVGLKSDFGKWSDSLAGSTMPIFTKGIEGLRGALPALTPLVHAAAGALGPFVDSIARGLKSGGFKQWVSDIAQVAGPALAGFLTTIKNIGRGVGALAGKLFTQFAPLTGNMTDSMVRLSGAFADWASNANVAPGFAKFMELADSGQGALGNLATAFGDLLVSLAPFMGATTIIAQGLADIIGAIPPGVITVLAQAFIAASVGMKAWAIATSIWSGVQRVATAVQWAMNSALFASPITWIVLGIVALVAVIVLIATKTTWFQQIWAVVWGAIKAVVAMHVDAIKAVIGWFSQLPGKFAGWFGAAKDWAVTKFTQLVTWLAGLPGRALNAINNLNIYIGNKAIQAGNALKNAVVNRAVSLLNWLGGLGSRTVRAVGNFHALLYDKGRDVITGLWNGISGMGGWLWSKVTSFVRSNVVDAAKSFLHIGSPSKLMADQIGRWVPAGVAQGIVAHTPLVDDAMRNMINPAAYRPAAAMVRAAPLTTTAGAPAGGRPLVATVRLDGNDPFMTWLKERIRIEYGGDVTALNSGR